jgi:hypothetical protein
MNTPSDSHKVQTPPEVRVEAEAGEAIRLDLSTYQVVQKLLNEDPFLLYIDETDALYHVRHSTDLELLVHKGRSLPEPFPAMRPALMQKAYRWLWMACLGLLFAGIGAMVFATLAAAAAIGLNFQPIPRADRIRSLLVLLLSGALWLGGLLLGAILLLHII